MPALARRAAQEAMARLQDVGDERVVARTVTEEELVPYLRAVVTLAAALLPPEEGDALRADLDAEIARIAGAGPGARARYRLRGRRRIVL